MREEIQRCTETLKKGGTILYPTDTIWGIGCDATDEEAVEKVYKIKQREDSKAMLVLVDSIRMLENYVEEVPEIAYEILEAGENALTIIYPGAFGLAGNLCAEDGSVGIRITREAFSAGLIKAFGKPLVSSSANLAGQPSPAGFNEISDLVLSSTDYVANWKS